MTVQSRNPEMVGRLAGVNGALKPFGQVADAVPRVAVCVSVANGMSLLMADIRGDGGKAPSGNQVIDCDAVLGHPGLYPENRGSAVLRGFR